MRGNSRALALLVFIMGMAGLACSPMGEEGRVRKQFDLLSERISVEPGEKPLAVARKIHNLETLFAPQCTLKAHIDAYSGAYTPGEIADRAAGLRSQFSRLTLQFFDIDIGFPRHGLAMVRATARLTGATPSGEALDETHELSCSLVPSDGAWLFTRVEVVEVLRR